MNLHELTKAQMHSRAILFKLVPVLSTIAENRDFRVKLLSQKYTITTKDSEVTMGSLELMSIMSKLNKTDDKMNKVELIDIFHKTMMHITNGVEDYTLTVEKNIVKINNESNYEIEFNDTNGFFDVTVILKGKEINQVMGLYSCNVGDAIFQLTGQKYTSINEVISGVTKYEI